MGINFNLRRSLKTRKTNYNCGHNWPLVLLLAKESEITPYLLKTGTVNLSSGVIAVRRPPELAMYVRDSVKISAIGQISRGQGSRCYRMITCAYCQEDVDFFLHKLQRMYPKETFTTHKDLTRALDILTDAYQSAPPNLSKLIR